MIRIQSIHLFVHNVRGARIKHLLHHQSSLISIRCHKVKRFHHAPTATRLFTIPSNHATGPRDCHRSSDAKETKLPSIQEWENLHAQKTIVKDINVACDIACATSHVGKKPKWEIGLCPWVNWLMNHNDPINVRPHWRPNRTVTDCALETTLHHRKLGLAIAKPRSRGNSSSYHITVFYRRNQFKLQSNLNSKQLGLNYTNNNDGT